MIVCQKIVQSPGTGIGALHESLIVGIPTSHIGFGLPPEFGDIDPLTHRRCEAIGRVIEKCADFRPPVPAARIVWLQIALQQMEDRLTKQTVNGA